MIARTLEQLRDNWEGLARQDALWAVLTGPTGAAREWDLAAFLATGAAEIDSLMERLDRGGMRPGSHLAVDFGCGIGRLTQALADHFDHVIGVDISATMIERARAINSHPERCEYLLNERDDLRVIDDGVADLVYSNIVLQHIPPPMNENYVRELLRIAREGGLVVFQVPAEEVAGPEPPRSRATKRLPRKACRAELQPEATALTVAPSAAIPVVLRVTNLGSETWPALGKDDEGNLAVRVGNHWRRWGLRIQRDEVRATLPKDIAPGETFEIGLWATAPRRPGRYVLELDVVQEMVRWFARAGSRTARIAVTVDAALKPDTVIGLPPKMQMHGIPRPRVEELIALAGGELLAVDPDDSPGVQWTSFRYFARKVAGKDQPAAV